MATFDPAPDRANRIIRETIDQWFPDLVEANVRVGAVFAYPALDKDGDPKGPAMKKDGRQVLSKIKTTGEEDRAAGAPDVTITLDAKEWERLEDEHDAREQLAAFVGDRLEGIVVEREETPGMPRTIKTNDQGRPKLHIKPYDYVVHGWRGSTVKFGARSPAKKQAREFHDTCGNLLFDFANDHAVQRDQAFAQEVLGLTEQAVEEINRDHKAVGMPEPFPNARPKRKPRAAAVAATNR